MVLGVFKPSKTNSAVLFKGFMQGSNPCFGSIGSPHNRTHNFNKILIVLVISKIGNRCETVTYYFYNNTQKRLAGSKF